MNDNPAKKAREKMKQQAQELRALLRVRGELRKWEPTPSDGFIVMQLVSKRDTALFPAANEPA